MLSVTIELQKKCSHCNKTKDIKYFFQEKLTNTIEEMKTCNPCRNSDGKLPLAKNPFSNNEKAKYWDYKKNGFVRPEHVNQGSDVKRWFICCHSVSISPSNISGNNRWCSYCANPPRSLCDDSDCEQCKNKSFAVVRASQYWSKKNSCTPRQVFKGSGNVHIFDCPFCNKEYRGRIVDVTNGRWCTCRLNKTEALVGKLLKETYIEVEGQYNRMDWMIFKMIYVEVDGKQHFDDIPEWESFHEKNMAKDIEKMLKAKEEGKYVIRIDQRMIWKNKNEWDKKLLTLINVILFSRPQEKFYYIANHNLYDIRYIPLISQLSEKEGVDYILV
jgi:hypothetical protein